MDLKDLTDPTSSVFHPEVLPTMPDEIVPMSLVDQGVLCRMLSVNAYLIVNGRLQPEILCEAFKQLVTLWPKLGARLGQNREVRSFPTQMHTALTLTGVLSGPSGISYSKNIHR